MDLGECPKIHDLALRADYELASKTKDYFYDIDVSIICLLLITFDVLFWPLEYYLIVTKGYFCGMTICSYVK